MWHWAIHAQATGRWEHACLALLGEHVMPTIMVVRVEIWVGARPSASFGGAWGCCHSILGLLGTFTVRGSQTVKTGQIDQPHQLPRLMDRMHWSLYGACTVRARGQQDSIEHASACMQLLSANGGRSMLHDCMNVLARHSCAFRH